MLATASELKAQGQKRYANVTVQGQELRIQSLSAREYLEYLQVSRPQKKDVDASLVYLVAACLVDEDGKRLFLFNDVADLMALDSGMISETYLECVKHCGLGRADDAEKKSEPIENSDSP